MNTTFTIWYGTEYAYLYSGNVFFPFGNAPKLKLYRGKYIYFLKDDNYNIYINLGSRIIESEGIFDAKFLNHDEFFDFSKQSNLNKNIIYVALSQNKPKNIQSAHKIVL